MCAGQRAVQLLVSTQAYSIGRKQLQRHTKVSRAHSVQEVVLVAHFVHLSALQHVGRQHGVNNDDDLQPGQRQQAARRPCLCKLQRTWKKMSLTLRKLTQSATGVLHPTQSSA